MKLLGRTKRARDIRAYLLESIKNSKPSIVVDVSEKFGVSRQTVSRHLAFLTENEWVSSVGHTRNKVYQLGKKRFNSKIYDLRTIKELARHPRYISSWDILVQRFIPIGRIN